MLLAGFEGKVLMAVFTCFFGCFVAFFLHSHRRRLLMSFSHGCFSDERCEMLEVVVEV